MTTGRQITWLREETGISIEETAKLTGLSEKHIRLLENDEVRPSPTEVRILVDNLNSDYVYLMKTSGYLEDLPITETLKKENEQLRKDIKELQELTKGNEG